MPDGERVTTGSEPGRVRDALEAAWVALKGKRGAEVQKAILLIAAALDGDMAGGRKLTSADTERIDALVGCRYWKLGKNPNPAEVVEQNDDGDSDEH